MTITPVKLIVCAESGAGKTGGLASLLAAGYNVRVIDADNGCDILQNYANGATSPYVLKHPDIAKRLDVQKVREPRALKGKLGVQKAEMWGQITGLLENWPEKGSIATWGLQDVLVVDTFTRTSDAAMRFVLAMNGRLNQKPFQSDYHDAQTLLKSFLEIIFDPAVGCNVVLNCHVQQVEDDNGVNKEYPMSVGKALAPVIGTYVNSLLTIRAGKLCTTKQGTLGVKNTAPYSVAASYPLETGLADYFAAVRGT